MHREPIIETMELTELYKITLLKDYPKNENDIKVETILSCDNNRFSLEKFLFWIDEPCDLNYEIDSPYYKVIKYLNKYTQKTFRTDRYLFYSKRDNDYSFTNNFYAYDLKNKVEIKLYTLDSWNEFDRIYTPPKALKDIVIEDLSCKLSFYQKRQFKRAFIKLANEENLYFNVKNYWVMELVKLAVQPVLVLHEWDCHRCFCEPKLFGQIYVYDIPSVDEEPSFFVSDKHFTKVAVLKFKSPEYLIKGTYKRGMAKTKGWKLNKQEVKELIEFLNAPSNGGKDYGKSKMYDGYRKYVKTNWQQLIFEYNRNTAYWECDGPIVGKIEGEIEQLPFDLPMPDYTKLNEETEEISDYVKELIKPENLIGPFDSTEEMLKSLWDEEK